MTRAPLITMQFIVEFFSLIGALFWLCALAGGCYSFFHGLKLMRWLRNNNYDRWEKLTSAETFVGTFGPGIVNAKKLWKYLYDGTDKDIEQVLRFKDNVKIGMRYMGLFILSSLVAFGLVVGVILYNK